MVLRAILKLFTKLYLNEPLQLTCGLLGKACSGVLAAFQTCIISLYAESLESREPNTCRSSRVQTPTALGMIRATFSFVIRRTDIVGIRS